MEYDPIKDRLGTFFKKSPLLKRLFFRLLNLFFLRAWHVRRMLKEIKRSSKTIHHILDAGTGFGQYAYFMAKIFPTAHILAVDIKQDYLDDAKAFFDTTTYKNRLQFEYADLTQYTSTSKFDLVLSVDVMEHIEDDVAVFKNFYKVVQPNGLVIINTPSDLGGSDVSEEHAESFIGEHVRDGYNKEELQTKLENAGFSIKASKYTYGKYGTIAWRFLIKYPMQWIHRSWFFALFLPLYYLPVFPLGMLLNWLDVHTDNERGTGLLVLAEK